MMSPKQHDSSSHPKRKSLSGKTCLLVGMTLAIGIAGGYWLASHTLASPSAMTDSKEMEQAGKASDMSSETALGMPQESEEKAALYWYDPMFPQQHFPEPGKSPFMDMQLVPRYAGGGGDSAAISIDGSITQNLGTRTASVTRGPLTQPMDVTGQVGFNERNVSIIQARREGFVERVYARAPSDILAQDAPLADLLIPEWIRAQEEYLALRGMKVPALMEAARQRMRLVGMPPALIAKVVHQASVQPVWTATVPTAGMLSTLDVREGMTLATGQTLATINGLQTVWLEAAVPEADAHGLVAGQAVDAALTALPGQPITGRIDAILPELSKDSRSLRVRIELDNPSGALRPGMSARVRLQGKARQAVLSVPTEAVIKTGKRSLVMLALEKGRYQPQEVLIGVESGERTEIVAGLQEGQKVITSGQFLLDSEASLLGIDVTTLNDVATTPADSEHEARGEIRDINADGVQIAHGPLRTLGMPGMTMRFPLSTELQNATGDTRALMQALKIGSRVNFAVHQTEDGLEITQIAPVSMNDTQEVAP